MGDPFTASWPLLEYTLKGLKLQQDKSNVTSTRTRLPILAFEEVMREG